MKFTDALDLLKEILDPEACYPLREIAEVIIYAYDKGWEEGQQDLYQEQSRINK